MGCGASYLYARVFVAAANDDVDTLKRAVKNKRLDYSVIDGAHVFETAMSHGAFDAAEWVARNWPDTLTFVADYDPPRAFRDSDYISNFPSLRRLQLYVFGRDAVQTPGFGFTDAHVRRLFVECVMFSDVKTLHWLFLAIGHHRLRVEIVRLLHTLSGLVWVQIRLCPTPFRRLVWRTPSQRREGAFETRAVVAAASLRAAFQTFARLRLFGAPYWRWEHRSVWFRALNTNNTTTSISPSRDGRLCRRAEAVQR